MTYVYIIGEVATQNRLKIGISENAKKRVKQLQTGSPEKLKILHTWQTQSLQEARDLEQQAHLVLNKFRLSGEWFEIDLPTAKKTIENILNKEQIEELNKKERQQKIEELEIKKNDLFSKGSIIEQNLKEARAVVQDLTTDFHTNLKESAEIDKELRFLKDK